MNTNTETSNNKIIDINNMRETFTLLNLGTIPELEASIRTVEPPEEIIADISLESLSEAQDDLLFVLKHSLAPESIVPLDKNEDEAADNHKIPRKRVKTFHEHPIPEPMDICIGEGCEKWMYSCCAGCVLTDGQKPLEYCRRAYPNRVIESYSDDSDDEREIDEYDPHRVFKSAVKEDKDDEEDEYLTEIWILEQEAKRRYPRRRRPEGLEEIAVRLFEEDLIMPVLEDEELMPAMPVLQRQNTQFPLNGVQVYNGNSNGSRFFDDYADFV
jgi:hypothetical protein